MEVFIHVNNVQLKFLLIFCEGNLDIKKSYDTKREFWTTWSL